MTILFSYCEIENAEEMYLIYNSDIILMID
jgi:hypothetical protein